ncbi:MAG: hypothetical protein LPK85_02685, partial [Gammaproteobacteria bacterium]|nr:hypothetical protein [Gammaproteobacteria bacterium]
DQVGGVGAARNLFPITHQANQAHESQIESRVKQWVNTQRYWVYYRVTVSLNGHQLDASKPVVQNYVNASLACEAAVYDLKGDKHNTLTATIVSTYTPPGETQATDFAAVTGATGPTRDAETAVAVRPEDLAANVQLPARLGEYQLDADINRELDAAMIRKGRAEVDRALLTIANVGSALITTLHATAARFAEGNLVGVLSESEKSNLTRLNLLKGAILAKLRGLV